MNPSDHIVDVSESDFEVQVIVYSQQVPVVVDFWAEWCAPCRVIGPILENLATEAGGSFRLAKLNVDQNPKLAMRYAVQSIPSVKIFKDGVVVSEFVGAIPEKQIRDYLKEVIPNPSDLLLEKAWSLITLGHYQESESTFRQVLEIDPSNTSAQLGIVKNLLFLGRAIEAMEMLEQFPPSREQPAAEKLIPVAEAIIEQAQSNGNLPVDQIEAAYQNSIRLVQWGNIEAAMDGLLDVLRSDKSFQENRAKNIMIGLLELLGDSNSLARQYRNELASILF